MDQKTQFVPIKNLSSPFIVTIIVNSNQGYPLHPNGSVIRDKHYGRQGSYKRPTHSTLIVARIKALRSNGRTAGVPA